jgi:ectoine hydroxylase-related dioxygenase (phytanoyl-CoA dioxygenase family)
LTAEKLQQLDELGWAVLPRVMDRGLLHEIRARAEQLWTEEGANAGAEFRKEPGARRLANLMDKGEVFERVVTNPGVLAAVRHVLGGDFKLSSLNARSTDPWSLECQPLHCDAGAVADESGFWVCNTIWLLDDFTPTNGATRIVPGSHRWRKAPQQELADPQAPHPEEILVLGEAGTVVVMNTHAGTAVRQTASANRAARSMRFIPAGTSRSSSTKTVCCGRRRRPGCLRSRAASGRLTTLATMRSARRSPE